MQFFVVYLWGGALDVESGTWCEIPYEAPVNPILFITFGASYMVQKRPKTLLRNK